MSTLLWPGDERAGDLLSDEAFLEAPLARAAGVLA